MKTEYDVPMELQSCHTAIVDGYVVEGHVPIEQVKKILAERPHIIGIGVAGMPVGSPGMETADGQVAPYDVVSFDENGIVEVVASYP